MIIVPVQTNRVSALVGIPNPFNAVIFADSQFVAGGNSWSNDFSGRCITTSPDGLTWTPRLDTFGASGVVTGIAYGGGVYVSVGNDNDGLPAVETSADGITWTAGTITGFGSGAGLIAGIAFGAGIFVVVGNDGTDPVLASSPDGITWTTRTSGFSAGSTILSVAFGNSVFVAGGIPATGNSISTSSNGTVWTTRSNGLTSAEAVTASGSLLIAGGTNGASPRVVSSPTGVTWTNRTAALTGDTTGAGFGNGLFLLGGVGQIATSPDGITWTLVDDAFTIGYLTGFTYGAGLWIAVTGVAAAEIWKSSDGTTWTRAL